MNNNIYYCEATSKPNIDTIGITASMWKQHIFEIILTSNHALNIQYAIGKVFGSRERALFMGVNAHFGPTKTNIPYTAPKYRPGQSKFQIDYYR